MTVDFEHPLMKIAQTSYRRVQEAWNECALLYEKEWDRKHPENGLRGLLEEKIPFIERGVNHTRSIMGRVETSGDISPSERQEMLTLLGESLARQERWFNEVRSYRTSID